MKYDKLMSEHKKQQAGLVAKREKLEQLRHTISDLAEAAETAASEGNAGEYTRLKNQQREVEAEAYVLNKVIDRTTTPFTPEDARDAWNEYSEKAIAAVAKKYAQYKTTRADLLQQLKDLAGYVDEVSTVRRTCISLSGDDETNYRRMPVSGNEVTHDLRFFMQLGMLSLEQLGAISTILNTQRGH